MVEEVQGVAVVFVEDGVAAPVAGGARPPMRWSAVNSGFVLRRICEFVGKGARPDKGFKEVHVNQVAKALKEFSGEDVTSTQVYNHLRKWRQRWGKVCKLQQLSGALWDEATCSIVLEQQHYIGHIKDHPKDAEFLNRPIEHYNYMQTAFGATMATGKYAMGSGEALGVPSGYGESDGVKLEPVEGDVSKKETFVEKTVLEKTLLEKAEAAEGSKATDGYTSGTKRKRSCFSEHEALLMSNMTDAVNNVAAALRETGEAHVDDQLYDAVMGASGFTDEALMVVFSHLLDNKAQARGFIKMTEGHRDLWLRTWLGKHYY